MLDLQKLFDKHREMEYLEFKRIERPLHHRPDMHAFLLLDSLVPNIRDIVTSAEHDEIWLSVKPEDIAKVATKEQIVELIRCGVRLDDDGSYFCMFV